MRAPPQRPFCRADASESQRSDAAVALSDRGKSATPTPPLKARLFPQVPENEADRASRRLMGWYVTPAPTGSKLREDGGGDGLLLYLWRCGGHGRNLSPHVFGYIKGDATVWRNESLDRLTRDGEVMAYRHEERCLLEDLGHRAAGPWRVE
jgi:hypothetical protein